jgi:methyl-accepting chemotaxis protein
MQIIAAHMEMIVIAADEQRETIADFNSVIAVLDQITQQYSAIAESIEAESKRL